MSLSKKHFEQIAAAFRNTAIQAVNSNDAGMVWVTLRREIADICQEQNPHFNRRRFYRATDPNGKL